MSVYENFSSLPPEKERDFVVYEKTSVESSKKALRIGMITALSFGFLVVVIVLGINAKPENKMANDDMGMLQKAEKKKADEKKAAEAKAKAEAEAEAAAADTPDEAAGDDEDKEGEAAGGDEDKDDSAGGDEATGDGE